MKTQPASRTLDLSQAHTPIFDESLLTSSPDLPATGIQDRTAMRDALSFSISFAVIVILTGAMLLYRVGVTVSGLTYTLFYASLAGMLIFAVRAIVLARQRPVNEAGRPELN